MFASQCLTFFMLGWVVLKVAFSRFVINNQLNFIAINFFIVIFRFSKIHFDPITLFCLILVNFQLCYKNNIDLVISHALDKNLRLVTAEC